MYEAILVPTDGGPGTSAVIDHALAIAERFDATVHAVSVLKSDQSDEELALAAVEQVEVAAERSNIPAITAVRHGIPYEELLAYATDQEIDLVVMGTHGRTGLNRYALG
jgi:nucleotide-binding universal stress UspA family protein